MITEPNNLAALLPPDKKSLPGVGIQKCGPYTNQVGEQANPSLKDLPMDNLNELISNLKDKWSHLHDLDRGKNILQILNAGMSGRSLARALGVSEGLVRNLKALTAATPEDRRMARRNEIRTRELLRRIAERQTQAADEASQAEEQACLEVAQVGAGEVLQWFYDEQMAHAYAEQVVLEGRRKLFEAERDGKLPKEKAPAGPPVSEIIRCCDLIVPPCTDYTSFVDRYADWFTLWSYHAMTDARVRETALDIVLAKLASGWWPDQKMQRRRPQRLATASQRRKHAPAKSAKRQDPGVRPLSEYLAV
jgi:hypothetical protein